MKILLARLSTVLRRREATPTATDGGVLKTGPLTIDAAKHEATVDGELVRLTLTEFKLLTALVVARGRVLTRDQLMDKAMGTDVFVTDRAIDVHITAIRKKLGRRKLAGADRPRRRLQRAGDAGGRGVGRTVDFLSEPGRHGPALIRFYPGR